ncbi:ribosomal protein l14 [Phaffia rhodozyma]|uniref:Large ribosomal subunit protein uL14m n=1 Tax=Phaffia rhodozyma TaxID=264483 RepID=A0A0F7SL81_PHARH|nr:ribosomal protein l14 [Phaffia rhodozyma]
MWGIPHIRAAAALDHFTCRSDRGDDQGVVTVPGACGYVYTHSLSVDCELAGLRAKCVVADNSGALIATIIDVMGRPAKALGKIGDEVTVVVERAKPIAVLPKDSPAHVVNAQTQKVRRGDVKRAVIVRTRKPIQRPDGRSIRFDDNACVLLNQKGDMIGTRVTGIVAAELRRSGRWGKVMSLSPKVI